LLQLKLTSTVLHGGTLLLLLLEQGDLLCGLSHGMR
jgi:hypothetical protein